MTEQFANNATTTLNGSITSTATSLVVTLASSFPTSPQFRIIIDSEIMLVTAVSGTTFTVSRGVENTTQASHSNLATVSMILTSGALDQLRSDLMNLETIGHRLTLSSGLPITTSDVTGSTAIYMTPFKSTRIALWTGSLWKQLSTGEINFSLGTLLSGTAYDVFAYINGSNTVSLELSNPWASTTSRTDALAQQDGVWVKSVNATRRYVGTFFTTATTTTEDSRTNRYVWNMYNQVPRQLYKSEATSTANWQYGSTTVRAANGNSANSFNYMSGDPNGATLLDARVFESSGGVVSGSGRVGIGIDSTTTNSSIFNSIEDTNTSQADSGPFAVYQGYPGIGKHNIVWLEWAQSGSNTRFFGTQSGDSVHGIIGTILA